MDGAYFLGGGLTTETTNVGGTSTSDAFSTLTLNAITTPDGSITTRADYRHITQLSTAGVFLATDIERHRNRLDAGAAKIKIVFTL